MAKIHIRHIYPDEYDAVVALVSASFGQDDASREHLLQHWQHHIPQQPDTSIEDLRAIIREDDDGQMPIAFARLTHRHLYYGRSRLKAVFISHVCTHPAYRHQGYSARLMRDTLAFLAEQGGHVVMLYDPATYYQRYGFTSLFPDYRLHISRQSAWDVLAELPAHHAPDVVLRPVERADLPSLAHLYDKHWRGRISLHREANLWRWRWQAQTGDMHIVQEGTGQETRVTGYVWQHHLSGRYEIVTDSEQASQALLAYCTQICQEDELVWHVPPDASLVASLQMWVPLELRAQYQPSSGWMGRLNDTSALLNAILPELRAQAKSSSQAPLPMDMLMLSAEPDSVVIAWRNHAYETIRISHRDFLPLLFGTLRPMSLVMRHKITPAQADLLGQLFPQRIASIGAWDMP
jgi:predicted acetyltransferase